MACCGKGMHPRPARERKVVEAAVRPQYETKIDGTKKPTEVEKTTTVMASRKAFTVPDRK